MTIIRKYDNINEAAWYMLEQLSSDPDHITEGRCGMTKELINASFEVINIKDNDIRLRPINRKFQEIEARTFLQGKSRPLLLMRVLKNIRNFVNPYFNQFDGDYAPRIGDAIRKAYWELKRNPNSRRALIMIRTNQDSNPDSLDQPCTLSFQFLIRNDKLIMITNMRSNDAYISLAGYDLMNFTFLQKALAYWLMIDTGSYFHNVGSLHLYEQHWKATKELLSKQPAYYLDKSIKTRNEWNCGFRETDAVLDEYFLARENE
jgi:thymidylate synthase